MKKSLAAFVLAALLLAEAHAGILPVFTTLTAVETSAAYTVGDFAEETAEPKLNKTWIASITCRSNNGQQQTFGGSGDPEVVLAAVQNAITSNNLPITKPTAPLLRSDGGWNTNDNLHNETLNAVCAILGFDSYVTSTCRDEERTGHPEENTAKGHYPNGKCNFHTPHNNEMFRFHGTFQPPKPQCSDGIDNDGDGAVDLADFSCQGNPNGDSEYTPLAQCQDEQDNDGDGYIDALITGPQQIGTPVTKSYKGNQGPWNHITQGALAPTLVYTNLNAGEKVQALGATGAWSARIHHGVNELPQSCYDQGYISFTDGNNNTIGTHPIPTIANGFTVPQGASKLFVHVLDAPNEYFDNSGYRGNFTPCTATFVRLSIPACRDGIDNDGDGKVDSADSGCANPDDISEVEHDPSCTDPQDNDEGPNDRPKQCSDGVDNDGDGFIDFPADLGCDSPDDDNESPFNKPILSISTSTQTSPVSAGETAIFQVTAKNTGNAPANQSLRMHHVFTDQQGNILSNAPFTFTENSNNGVVSCAPHPSAAHRTVCSLINGDLPAGQQRNYGLRYTTLAGNQFCGQTLKLQSDIRLNDAAGNQQVLNETTTTITVQCQQTPQCSDGVDNDGDGKIDFPSDPGCSSPTDNDETDAPLNFTGTKSANVQSIQPGQAIIYTITAKNNANHTVDGIRVVDIVPAGLTFVPAASTAGCTLTANGARVDCPYQSYTAGQTRTFTLKFMLAANAQCGNGIQLDNFADIQSQNGSFAWTNHVFTPVQCAHVPQCRDGIDNDGDGLIDYPADPGCTNPDDDSEIDVTPTADLSITKSGPATIQPGSVISYTLTAKNAGPDTATNVAMQDQIPAGLTFNAGASDQSCLLHGGSVVCNNFTLAKNATKSVTVSFNVPAAAVCSSTILNRATVATSATDPNPANNQSQTVSTTVQCPHVPECRDGIDNDGDGLIDYPADPGCTNPDDDSEAPFNAPQLTITDTAQSPTVTAGEVAVFLINVKNNGTAPADSTLRIHNVFIDGNGNVIQNPPFSFESNTNTGVATCAPHPNAAHRIVCSLVDPLTPGAERTFGLRYTTAANQYCGQTITHQADVRLGQGNVNQQVLHTDTAQIKVVCAQTPQCSDGIDNDGDGKIDFPADPGCSSPTDNDETDAPLNFTGTKTANVQSIQPGQAIIYTITAKNNANHTVDGIRVVDIVPAGLTFVPAASTNGCTLNTAGNRVNCPYQSYAAGQTRTFTLKFMLAANAQCGNGVQLDNFADIQSQNGSFAWTNHVFTPVQCAHIPQCRDGIDNDGDGQIDFPNDVGCDSPDDNDETNEPLNFVVLKTASTQSVNPGDTIVYTIKATNNGTVTAKNIRIIDIKPPALTFVSAGSTPGCQLAGTAPVVVVCGFEDYAPGQSRTYTLAFSVPQNAQCGDIYDNVADVQRKVANGGASFEWSNHVKTPVSCPPQNPNFSITDTAHPTQVNAGDISTFKISVKNTGDITSDHTLRVHNIFIDGNGNGIQNAPFTFISNTNPDVSCSQHPNAAHRIVCSFSRNYAPGEVVNFDLTYRTPAAQFCGQTIRHQADVRLGPGLIDQTVYDTDTADVKIVCTQPTQKADLSITKAGPVSVVRGNSIVYTVSVYNLGPNTAQGVTINDPIPAGLVFNPQLSDASCVKNGANILCDNLTLAAGASHTVSIGFTVPTVAHCTPTTISNTATVSSSTTDPVSSNNVSQTVTTTATCPQSFQCSDGIDNDGDGKIDFPADPGCDSPTDNDETDAPIRADLSITKTSNAQSVVRGQNVVYTVTVQNHGPAAATNVTVTDNIPNHLTYVSVQGATCQLALPSGGNNGILSCDLGTIQSGDTKTFTLTFSTSIPNQCADVVVSNTVSVQSPVQDPNALNNTSTAQTSLTCPTTALADITVTKTGTPASVTRGQNVTYTLAVANNGAAKADNVILKDTFPSDLEYVSASGAVCSVSGNVVECPLAELAAGATKTVTLTFKAKTVASCTQSVTVTNTAAVTTTSTESSTSNNSSFAQTTINCAVTNTDTDLSVVKTGPSTFTYGQNVTYTLAVKNNGTVAATNVVVTDTHPSQMVFLSGSSSSQCSVTGGNTVKCTLATLAASQETSFTLVFQVGDPPSSCSQTTVTNTASVSATNTDPNSSNNSSTVSSTLTCGTGSGDQLSIHKTDGRSTAYTHERLRYLITVNNNAGTSVSSITVTDMVPSGLSIISVSDGGVISGQTVTWSSLTFSPYQSRTFYIDVEVQDSVANGTVITNTATVGSKQATDQTTIHKVVGCQTNCNPPPPCTHNCYPQPPIYYPPVQPPVYYPPVSQPPVYYPPVAQPPIYSQPKGGHPPIYVYPETGDGNGALYGDVSTDDQLTAIANATEADGSATGIFYATLAALLAMGSAAASKFLLGGGMLLG